MYVARSLPVVVLLPVHSRSLVERCCTVCVHMEIHSLESCVMMAREDGMRKGPWDAGTEDRMSIERLRLTRLILRGLS